MVGLAALRLVFAVDTSPAVEERADALAALVEDKLAMAGIAARGEHPDATGPPGEQPPRTCSMSCAPAGCRWL